MSEHTIPSPPRPVRWRAASAHWWAFGLGVGLSLLIVTVTGLIMWLAYGADSPFPDWALDSEPGVAEAQVTQVDDTAMNSGGRRVQQVRYTFDLGDGRRRFGFCFAEQRRFQVGRRYDLEFLTDDPNVNRLQGSYRAMASLWLPFYFGWIWIPLFVLFLIWLRGALRLRGLLRDGTAAAARILSASRTRWVNPPHLRVRYEFTDRGGERQADSHWVRVNSHLARHIAALGDDETPEHIVVIYDEVNPTRSRLACPDDFAGGDSHAVGVG